MFNFRNHSRSSASTPDHELRLKEYDVLGICMIFHSCGILSKWESLCRTFSSVDGKLRMLGELEFARDLTFALNPVEVILYLGDGH